MSKSYELYISEIKDKILSPEEETRLIKLYQSRSQGWQEAQDAIIKSNLMYVVKVAFEYSRDQSKVNDLISEGNCALLESLERFNPDKGVKFITYANYEIRGRMGKIFINDSRLSYLEMPNKARSTINKIAKYLEDSKTNLGEIPNSREVAAKFEIKESTAIAYLEALNFKNFSLDDGFDNSSSESFGSLIKDDANQPPDQDLNFKQESSILKSIIENLPLKLQFVINKRFGFDGDAPQNLEAIGDQMQLTRERIRQLEASALKMIRKELEKIKF